MRFDPPLTEGILIKRYQRFLADVRLPTGEELTAHTGNTGSMLGCAAPGARVWLSRADNARRKYAYTWELVEVRAGVLVSINTARANVLAAEAIASGTVPELSGYHRVRREVGYGDNSRIDLLLQYHPGKDCYVEVKNVTLARAGVAAFPDAVTLRGRKHLNELIRVAKAGMRAVIFFCVARADVGEFRAARDIDPAYADALQQAVAAGVVPVALRARVSPTEVALCDRLPVVIG